MFRYGKIRSYSFHADLIALWKFRHWSFSPISVGKLRSYLIWNFSSYCFDKNWTFFRSFLQETLDLTLLEITSPVQCCFRAVFLWNRAVSELFRAVFLWFRAVQHWSKFVTFWCKIVKKNTTFAFFSVHFLLKTLYLSLFTILQITCDQEAWGKGGCANSNFRRNDFFVAGTLQKNMFSWSQYLFELKRSIFVDFSNRFDPTLNSAYSEKTSAEQLWNSADQRWFS